MGPPPALADPRLAVSVPLTVVTDRGQSAGHRHGPSDRHRALAVQRRRNDAASSSPPPLTAPADRSSAPPLTLQSFVSVTEPVLVFVKPRDRAAVRVRRVLNLGSFRQNPISAKYWNVAS